MKSLGKSSASKTRLNCCSVRKGRFLTWERLLHMWTPVVEKYCFSMLEFLEDGQHELTTPEGADGKGKRH